MNGTTEKTTTKDLVRNLIKSKQEADSIKRRGFQRQNAKENQELAETMAKIWGFISSATKILHECLDESETLKSLISSRLQLARPLFLNIDFVSPPIALAIPLSEIIARNQAVFASRICLTAKNKNDWWILSVCTNYESLGNNWYFMTPDDCRHLFGNWQIELRALTTKDGLIRKIVERFA
jgi:hypothetical protein